ncbi:MAG: HAD family hydrolase [Planctomycetota bacterium]|jgi:putative hydrolase of the HAD superfamily
MFTTVVFDLDDTLYDEIDYCRSGFTASAEFLAGLPKMPSAERIFEVFWQQFTSGNRKETFNTALEELGIAAADSDKLITDLIEVYRNHVPKITLPLDSRDVLDQLTGKYTLAMITDGFLPAQKLKVQALAIEKYFKCIIYTEALGREFWKPSPAGFKKIIQILNTEPKNIVYLADNEKKDFIAPNKLGFLTVQLIRPARIHTKSSPESGASARYVIQNITHLPALLDKF